MGFILQQLVAGCSGALFCFRSSSETDPAHRVYGSQRCLEETVVVLLCVWDDGWVCGVGFY